MTDLAYLLLAAILVLGPLVLVGPRGGREG